MPTMFLLALLFCLFAVPVQSREVTALQSDNFELALSTYHYAAILFYDDSKTGKQLVNNWERAAAHPLLESLSSSSEIAMIDGTDPSLKELVEAYQLNVPCVRIFRRGAMGEYRGPYESPDDIAAFLFDDSQHSVRVATSLTHLKELLAKTHNSIVLGFFAPDDVVNNDEADSYSIDAYGQFQSTADALRGHATLIAVTTDDVFDSFNVSKKKLPMIYMVSDDGQELLRYSGEIIEMNLSEWVLRNTAPDVNELTLATSAGEMFATQFFSSRKIKFILFLGGVSSINAVDKTVENLKRVSELFKGKALFAYMIQSEVADVIDYFGINIATESPLIVAHNPEFDYKYKSGKLQSFDVDIIGAYVSGVLNGSVKRVMKSEPVPTAVKGSKVVKLVGSTLLAAVSDNEKDVLLQVYTQKCAACRKLQATYDILGRALEGDSRLVVAKIDASLNDLPSEWGARNFPTLLWFPAKDKPYLAGPVPRPYWDTGTTLQEMFTFVVRDSSFDAKTLRVATMEQLGSLLDDEEKLRQEYDAEARMLERNENRPVYDNALLDYLAGEVVFDGKRWHVAAGAALALATALLGAMFLLQLSASKKKVKKI